jgi:hypothetical protein
MSKGDTSKTTTKITEKKDDKIFLYSSSVKSQGEGGFEDFTEAVTFLKEKLKASLRSEHILVLSGAGTSIGFGGKTMSQLWTIVENEVKDFSTILTLVKYTEEQKAFMNLEHLLSILQIEKRSTENKAGDVSKITSFINSIESIILKECSFQLPDTAPHDFFLKKLLKARKNIDPRIKLFTLNYDMSFETASDRVGAVLIDGFSFTQRQFFNPSTYDLDIVYREKSRIHSEESFYSKVIQLFKIHGSVTWRKTMDGIITKEKQPVSNAVEAVLIYPNSSKYEKSYEMPFFELVSRFQNTLRKENTTLLVIGYSFNDDHINRILRESVKSNSNLEVFIVKPNIKFDNHLMNEFKEWIDNGLTDLHLIGLNFQDFVKQIPEIVFDTENPRDNFIKK